LFDENINNKYLTIRARTRFFSKRYIYLWKVVHQTYTEQLKNLAFLYPIFLRKNKLQILLHSFPKSKFYAKTIKSCKSNLTSDMCLFRNRTK